MSSLRRFVWAPVNDMFLTFSVLTVSCSSDLTLRIWDVANDYSSRTLHGHDHSISSARFVPGDDFVVSASRDCTIKVWDVKNGWCVKTFTGHGQWVRCVVPSDDGKLLASCADDQVRLNVLLRSTGVHYPLHSPDCASVGYVDWRSQGRVAWS